MKATVREQMKRVRLAMSKAEVGRLSAMASARLVELEAFRAASGVMLYLPVRNEVDAMPVVTRCLNDGKALVLPRMDLVEPDPAKTAPAAPDQIDLVVVPGLAFDREGNRIGWGRGYYDAFLATLDGRAALVGLAYGFQVVEAIEHDGHDVPMDLIVTEATTLCLNGQH